MRAIGMEDRGLSSTGRRTRASGLLWNGRACPGPAPARAGRAPRRRRRAVAGNAGKQDRCWPRPFRNTSGYRRSFPTDTLPRPSIRPFRSCRESLEPGELVELHVVPPLIESERIHEVEVTLVIAADVIVVPELAIVVARIPVAERRHAVHQTAV